MAQPEVESTPSERGLGVVFWSSVGWIAALVFVALFRDLLPIRDPDELGIRTREVAKFEGPGWNAFFGADWTPFNSSMSSYSMLMASDTGYLELWPAALEHFDGHQVAGAYLQGFRKIVGQDHAMRRNIDNIQVVIYEPHQLAVAFDTLHRAAIKIEFRH